MNIAINIILTKVPVYCPASKRTLPQWCVKTNDHLAITFVNFFHEKYLYGNACPPALRALCAGEAPDEKLKNQQIGASSQCCTLAFDYGVYFITGDLVHPSYIGFRVICDLDILTKIVGLHIKS